MMRVDGLHWHRWGARDNEIKDKRGEGACRMRNVADRPQNLLYVNG